MEEILFRIILIGDSGVGKSCILLRFTQDTFCDIHSLTIGVEFSTKIIQIFNKQVKLQFWDTAGQEGFRSITRSFYRNADGIIIVYDLCNADSFNNCEFWLKEVRNNAPIDSVIHLLGNRSDLIEENATRNVSFIDGQNFAKRNNLNGFSEVSAKEGTGIADAFSEFCKVLISRWNDKNKLIKKPERPKVELAPKEVKKKKRRC